MVLVGFGGLDGWLIFDFVVWCLRGGLLVSVHWTCLFGSVVYGLLLVGVLFVVGWLFIGSVLIVLLTLGDLV